MSGVVFVPAQRLSGVVRWCLGVVLTLPVVSLQSRFATKSFRYRSFRYKVVSLRVVLLQSRFAASCPHSAEVDFTNEL